MCGYVGVFFVCVGVCVGVCECLRVHVYTSVCRVRKQNGEKTVTLKMV